MTIAFYFESKINSSACTWNKIKNQKYICSFYDYVYEKVYIDSQNAHWDDISDQFKYKVVSKRAHDSFARREMQQRQQSEWKLNGFYNVAPEIQMGEWIYCQHSDKNAWNNRNRSSYYCSFPSRQVYFRKALCDKIVSCIIQFLVRLIL